MDKMTFTNICVTLLIVWSVSFDTSGANPLGTWTYRDRKGDLVEVMDTLFHEKRGGIRGDVGGREKRGCRCMCRRKWEETFVCCDCGDTTCFPWSADVITQNGSIVKVSQLKRGDQVLTVDSSGKVHPTKVLGYLDHRSDVISRYYVIHTKSGASISLSGSHVIYVTSSNSSLVTSPRYAREVQCGDHLLVYKDNSTSLTMVTGITLEGMQGAYVPLTESGTLLVDNVLTSCYASFPHGIAHAAMAPLRWLPSLTDLTPADGVHPYVRAMKVLGRTFLPTNWLFDLNNRETSGKLPENNGLASSFGTGHSEL